MKRLLDGAAFARATVGTSTPLTPERLALLRAARMALGAWPAFALLDVYMGLVLFPASSLSLVLFYRALGEAVNVVGYAVIKHTRIAIGNARIAHAATYASMGLLISLMSLELGGLHSRYVHGVSIVVMVRAIVVPSRAASSLAWSLPIMLSFPVVHSIAGHCFGVADSAFTARRLAVFMSDYVFLVGSTVVGAAAGHLIWVAEQQLFRARKLGSYRLEAPLARGGMGEIWLAFDEVLRRRVALKILRGGGAFDATSVARFEREAQAASNLTSAHTIKIYDYGATEDGIRFIAMEYLDGADLGAVIAAHGAMDVARAIHLVRQACDSLAEAHDAGIIHRDIKPQNLFVTRVGGRYDWLKLLDFGIARFAEADGRDAGLTRTGVVPGTPAYVAPELWVGGRADVRSDVYALGATLFFLLTGHTPTPSDGSAESLVAPARGEEVGPELERIITRCLARDALARFASARELDAALAACPVSHVWTDDDAREFWLATHDETRRRWNAMTEP